MYGGAHYSRTQFQPAGILETGDETQPVKSFVLLQQGSALLCMGLKTFVSKNKQFLENVRFQMRQAL